MLKKLDEEIVKGGGVRNTHIIIQTLIRRYKNV